MKMKIIIPIIMLLVLMGIVSATTVVNLDPEGNLANNTYQTTNSITYGFNVTGNSSIYECYLYTNENTTGTGNWVAQVTALPTTNNTNTNFVVRTVADGVGTSLYYWDVKCNTSNSIDPTGAFGSNGSTTGGYTTMHYGVDATAPIVTIISPSSNGAWYVDDSAVTIGLNVTDTNANICTLQSNLDTDNDNTTTFNTAFENYEYTSETAFEFIGVNSSQDWTDEATGLYLWTYNCSDDAGNTAELGSNYTFFVDTVAPAAFIFDVTEWKTDGGVSISNGSTATDYTPQVGWNGTSELNFSSWLITFFLDDYGTYNSTTDSQINVSTFLQNYTNISTDLNGNANYWILVEASDMAGNKANMTTINYKYTTTSTNRELKSGWNIIGNVGNSYNLSDLRLLTGATTVSIWNSSNHVFISHVSGGSNGATSVDAGQAALVYMAADTEFSDSIWNTTAVAPNDVITLTNPGGVSAWNLAMNRAGNMTFQEVDSFMNCNPPAVEGCTPGANNASNINYMSFYDNSASAGAKYVSYVNNWSISNDTQVVYGEAVWLYTENNISVNWSAI